jgi:CheY-like chemotaxis protein
LRQILVNLLGNALKFTPQGTITLRVELQEKLPDRVCLLFKVIDTGIGIPEEKQATIFDAFSQADSSVTRQFGGTGLGLSISKQLIELMGGHIGLESEPNVSTTFFFTGWFGYLSEPKPADVPADVSTCPASLTESASEKPTMNLPISKQCPLLRILLVEDNLINQKLAKKFLEKQGHSVQIAHNGLEAVTCFEQHVFDLILMDFQMPTMNGLEATVKIRQLEQQRNGHIIIIAMTANALLEDEQRALTAGMDGYLPKPIDFQQLLALIAHFFPPYAAPDEAPALAELTALCDWEKALARLGGNHEILTMMVSLFLEEQPCYLRAIKAALQTQNAVELRRELHTLKSLCATFGSESLEAQLRELELFAVRQDFSQISRELVPVESNLQQLNQFLVQKIQSHG